MRTLYLDYNATTPLDQQVQQAMEAVLEENYGNPSSVHRIGRQARARLEDARDRLATVLACRPAEIIFTSGGTESVNLAIIGAARQARVRGKHLITSRIEHHAVLEAFAYLERCEGFQVTHLPVDSTGLVDPDSLRSVLRPDTILVSVMAANNEIGTIQPIAELGQICRKQGVIFHTDAIQWFGKENFNAIADFQADLVSIGAHKFHGPKGAGALYVRSGVKIDPVQFGGGHELGRRAGTENLAGIIGLCAAADLFLRSPVFNPDRLRPWRHQLRAELQAWPGVTVFGHPTRSLANTVAFAVAGIDSATILAALDLEGLCASAGAACSSGSLQPSHVLLALGADPETARSLVRLSLGREHDWEQIQATLRIIRFVVNRAQACQQHLSRP